MYSLMLFLQTSCSVLFRSVPSKIAALVQRVHDHDDHDQQKVKSNKSLQKCPQPTKKENTHMTLSHQNQLCTPRSETENDKRDK